MLTSRSVTIILVTTLFVTVGWSAHTAAYVDLGTGSYLLQMLFAGVFGAIFSAKSFWIKLRAKFASVDRSVKP